MKFSLIQNDFDFFINKINNKKYYSLARFNHGIWDKILKFKVPMDISDHRKMMIAAQIYCEGEQAMWKASPKVVYDCFDLMRNFDIYNKNESFYLAISHLGYPQSEVKQAEIKRVRNIPLYNNFIHKNAEVYDGLLFKKAIINNKFHKILDLIFNKNVIIVAPNNEDVNQIVLSKYFMENFGKRFGIKNFYHVDIHPFEAAIYYEAITSNVVEAHYKISKSSSEDTVILFKAGPLGPAIMKNLHGKLQNTFMIDIGNAFDIFVPGLNRPWKIKHSNSIIFQEEYIKKYDKIL